MSLLKNLTQDQSIATEKDSLGGGGVLDSGLYNTTVKMAYVTVAGSGALGLVLILTTDTGREIRETLWMSSGTAKGGKNYYERNGEKHYLPGYLNATALSLLTVGKDINELDTETKVVPVYSPEAKKEVPTKVEVVVDLLNQEIKAGVIKETVDKTAKADDGSYVPTGETRDQNTIDKFFRASDSRSVFEIRNEIEEAGFIGKWEEKWKGQVRDRTSKTAPKAATTASKKPTTSLFA